jgi:hypothetical protein
MMGFSDDRPDGEREDERPIKCEPEGSTVPSTKIAPSQPYGLPGPGGRAGRIRSNPRAEVIDREQLLDRLAHLRSILPVFAQELAGARHQASLRVENRVLLEEVRRLRAQRGQSGAAQR